MKAIKESCGEKKERKLYAAVRCSMLPNQTLGYVEIPVSSAVVERKENEPFGDYYNRLLPICCEESPCCEFLLFENGYWTAFHMTHGRSVVDYSATKTKLPEYVKFIK